jgi:hypothetical protein
MPFIESFMGGSATSLNVHQFASIADAQEKIGAGRVDYNQRRRHSSLGQLTPNEQLLARAVLFGRMRRSIASTCMNRRNSWRHAAAVDRSAAACVRFLFDVALR